MSNRISTGVVAALILAGVAFAAGYATHSVAHPAPANLSLLQEARALLTAHYLRSLPDATAQQRGMIRGMLGALNDPYTVYVDPAGHELETNTFAGEYGGIGAQLFRDTEGAVRIDPTPGGPAELAGVKEGDILLEVDGKPVEQFDDLESIIAAVRGLAGSRVRLKLAPGSSVGQPLEVEIQRATIDLPSASGYLLPEDETIGVIAVSVFSEKTPNEILTAYHDLAGRDASAVVLDLRGNGGGLLDSAVSVAQLFMNPGLIVVERRKGSAEERFSAPQPGELADVPLAVLVDGGTASAAEVVAAALQQNGRAPLVGMQTFGKGSVQVILPLSDGSSLHVTSAEWYTPNAGTLEGVGLTPDIRVEQTDDGKDGPLSAARDWLKQHPGGLH